MCMLHTYLPFVLTVWSLESGQHTHPLRTTLTYVVTGLSDTFPPPPFLIFPLLLAHGVLWRGWRPRLVMNKTFMRAQVLTDCSP
jgi:hypothetical protein